MAKKKKKKDEVAEEEKITESVIDEPKNEVIDQNTQTDESLLLHGQMIESAPPTNEHDVLIININEKERFNLSDNAGYAGDSFENIQAVTGFISVINPTTSRIWNLNLALTGVDTTTIPRESYVVPELKGQHAWKTKYIVKGDNKPGLSLKETINTFSQNDQVDDVFILGTESVISITLEITNISTLPITEINLKRNIPTILGTPLLETPMRGQTEFNTNQRSLSWYGIDLKPNESVSLVIGHKLTPVTRNAIDMGKTEIDYVIMDQSESKLDATLVAKCDHFLSIDEDESEEPGEWECDVEFENSSLFKINLEHLVVTNLNGNEDILNLKINKMIEPDGVWSQGFNVSSEDVPQLSRVMKFSPDFVIHRRISGHVYKRARELPVANMGCEIIIDPPEVSSYDKPMINVNLITNNTGTSTIDNLTYELDMPVEMLLPKEKEIIISVNGKEHKNFAYSSNPPEDDNKLPHFVTINVNEINLKPDKNCLVNLYTQAWKPRPQIPHPFSMQVSSRVISLSEYPLQAATDKDNPPMLTVNFVRRKLRKRKRVRSDDEGKYTITITFENKGDVMIDDINVIDSIPKGYKLISASPDKLQPTPKKESDASISLEWTINRIDAGEKIIITYQVQGKGIFEPDEVRMKY